MNSDTNQVKWPKRAVVTAGMPYGNKELHFGHVGGVFVPADCFSRFLKDRIGYENVLFISGTDCFGSPIDEGYRKLKNEGFEGTINDYVQANHNKQAETLKKYDIDLSIFEGSGIGRSGQIHQELSDEVLKDLYKNGWLNSAKNKQFYDTKANMFLNGRQVHGRCPVQGCKSEDAYADECSLGHQYAPEDLIAPKSSVTDTIPEMRDVKNWYFNLPEYRKFLINFANELKQDKNIRKVVVNDIKEFLAPPIVFVKCECFDVYESVKNLLPKHTYRPAEGNKQSFTLEFETIYDRDSAKNILNDAGIRFRTGKTLVPFRLTGNAEWGVKAPNLDNTESSANLTIWCWPESLWAPISFTMAALENQNNGKNSVNNHAEVGQFCGELTDREQVDGEELAGGEQACEKLAGGEQAVGELADGEQAPGEMADGEQAPGEQIVGELAGGEQACEKLTANKQDFRNKKYTWKDFWCSDDSTVYQLIGQDNIYFYGVAQPALFDAFQNTGEGNSANNLFVGLHQTKLVANHHILFGKTKASSSGAVKPPSADELLNYYTVDQLRAHWLALGLAQKSVSFSPKPFEADESKRNDPRVADPVLKEGTLLTNVFNRLARSCFYEAKNNFDCKIELLQPNPKVIDMVKSTLNTYENYMHKVELYSIMQLMDKFIRDANKWWTEGIAKASKEELSNGIDVRKDGKPSQFRKQVLADSFYLLYASTLMMHPVVPSGCETINKHMNFDANIFFNWDNIYKGIDSGNAWSGLTDKNIQEVLELPPRFDFFSKHESQYKKKKII